MTLSIAELEGIESGPLVELAWLRGLCRRLLLSKLRQIRHGFLRVHESGGEVWEFGQEGTELFATVHIDDPLFYPKVVFGGSIGAAEAYVAGAWRTDDLTRLLRLFVANRAALEGLEGGLGAVLAPFRRALQWWRANSRSGSRRNIRAHYDLSNEFFELFLDRHQIYSAAIFPTENDDLDAASEFKLERICQKLDLGPEDHLLEIGSGWGGLATYAAQRFGCRVTTTTISQEQFAAAKSRVAALGLEGRVEVLLEDYRDLRGTYDKLVSIEMIEAVGHEYLETFFATCSARLKPDGLMVLQAITIADRYYAQARSSVDFIQRYIFPGSAIPSLQAMLQAVVAGTDLQLVHSEDIGPHYARTLRAWRRRFFARIQEVKALGFSERFVRLWEYYLCYCEAGFLERSVSDVQWVLAKPNNRRLPLLGRLETSKMPSGGAA